MNNCTTACEPKVAQCHEWADRAINAASELEVRIEELEKRLCPVLRSEGSLAGKPPQEPQPTLVPVASVFRELYSKNDRLILRVRTLLDLLEI